MDRIEHFELRKTSRFGQMATGSLACCECDAPVALRGPTLPSELLVCPFCEHRGPLRDFLSLGAPVRPAVVAVHIRPVKEKGPVPL